VDCYADVVTERARLLEVSFLLQSLDMTTAAVVKLSAVQSAGFEVAQLQHLMV
jgi:hypothetical protein